MNDLRYGARLLRRSPSFALTAIVSLAVGLGATIAIFTIGNGLLLRSASGVADPGRLVDIVITVREGAGIVPVAFTDYLEMRNRADMLEGLFGYELDVTPVGLRVGDAGAERIFANTVTANYFSVLGVEAAAGRLFTASTDERIHQPLAVLSHRFWMRRFNGDRAVIGQSISVNSVPMTIVGVATESFHGIGLVAPDLWVPSSMASAVHPDRNANGAASLSLMLGGRLKPGMTRAQASAQIAAIGDRFARDKPVPANLPPVGMRELSLASSSWSAETASPIPYALRGRAAAFLGLLMAIVGVVLVIACTNIAGILLARTTARKQEIAVRAALGAPRVRIVRQLLTETLVLFCLGGTVGIVLARWMTSLLVSLLPTFPVPVNLSVPLDGRVVAFSLGVTIVVAIASGLVPALHAAKTDIVSTLKDDGHADPMRLRSAFVVGQVAFSLLLVVTAGLFLRGFQKVADIDHGFDARHVDAVSLDLSMAGYTASTGPAFAHQLLDRVRAVPGVTVATVADKAPGPGVRARAMITVPGYTPADVGPRRPAVRTDGAGRFIVVNWTIVEPGYFATLRMPLIVGRDFLDTDREGAQRVAIVSEAAAKRFWPEQDPIGQQVLLYSSGPNAASTPPVAAIVVGVVRDVNFEAAGTSGRLDLYVPLQQQYVSEITLMARHAGDTSNMSALRAMVRSLNPNLSIVSDGPLERRSGPIDTQLRIAATVAGSIGIVGVLLAAVGTYGVTAYAVARRTREIAIRLSLGAAATDVASLVLRNGLIIVVLGSALGCGLAFATGRLIAAKTGLSVPSADPLVFGAMTALLVVINLTATMVPVLRATRINPSDALRYE